MFTLEDNITLAKLLHVVTADAITGSADSRRVSAAKLVAQGIVLISADNALVNEVDTEFAQLVCGELGLNNDVWSNTFHKDWDKVANTTIEQLVFEQLVHYWSTYGMETIGLAAMPLIPREKVISDPEALPDIRAFTVIRVVDESVAISIVKEYIKGLKAPHKCDVQNISNLMWNTDLGIEDIQSFELKAARCKQLKVIPKNGQDFLRYVVYIITGSPLLIKDTDTIRSIRTYCRQNPVEVFSILNRGDKKELAKIFYRYKPIFLAFKESSRCKSIINKIRRLAVIYHEPVSGLTASNLMNLLNNNNNEDALKIVEKADNRTLIKLINFASNIGTNTKVYNIRNGKTFITKHQSNINSSLTLFNMCYRQLAKNTANKLVGKTFLIPKYIDYAVPVSNKQCIGNFPYGTKLNFGENDSITVAIWWQDYQYRTDIDFHLCSANEHFGWDGDYRSENILFSGDMTSADPYASEAYKVALDGTIYMLSVCLFDGCLGAPFKFIITENSDVSKKSPVNVEDAMFTPINLKFDSSTHLDLGFIQDNTFVFYKTALGTHVTPDMELNRDALDALVARCANAFRLKDFIIMCGGQVIENMSEMSEDAIDVIDLSPNAITATTLLDIID